MKTTRLEFEEYNEYLNALSFYGGLKQVVDFYQYETTALYVVIIKETK